MAISGSWDWQYLKLMIVLPQLPLGPWNWYLIKTGRHA